MNCLRHAIACALVAGPAITSVAIQAQEPPMEEVLVTADPLSRIDDHMIQPSDVLDSETLKNRSIQNIGETVAGELGVTSSDFGAGAGRPVIRGMSGGRVKVLENGISTMDVSTISGDHAVTTEPVFAEQVEILRGPATLLYGSGASGGLVNVVSNRIPAAVPESPTGTVVLQYETVNDGFTGAAGLRAGSGSLAFQVDGMYRDTSDYDIPGYAELEPDAGEEPGSVENSAVETDNIGAGISWLGDTFSAGFAISGMNSSYGIPGHHHHHEEENADPVEEGGVTVDMEQVRYDVMAGVNSPFSGMREIRTRFAYNDYEHAELEPDGAIGTQFSNEELEGRIEAIHQPLGDIWDGVLGIQINRRDFAATGEEGYVPASEQDALAVFVVEKADFGRWHVDLGARYEDQDSRSENGDAISHGLVSLSGGVNVDVGNDNELGISLGSSQRGPTIEEMFSNGPHAATGAFEIGNPLLGDETSLNLDLHWHKTAGRHTYRFNLFYNAIDNFIYLQEQDLNDDGIPDRVAEDFSGDIAEILGPDETEEPLLLMHTQANARFYGLELEGIHTLFNSDAGIMDLRLWGDYVKGELTSGENLPRISPWRFGVGIDYDRGPWSVNLDYTRVAHQGNTSPLETVTAGYDMLNLYAAWNQDIGTRTVTLYLRGTNLLDQEARRHTSFVKNVAPLAGRSFIVGVRAGF